MADTLERGSKIHPMARSIFQIQSLLGLNRISKSGNSIAFLRLTFRKGRRVNSVMKGIVPCLAEFSGCVYSWTQMQIVIYDRAKNKEVKLNGLDQRYAFYTWPVPDGLGPSQRLCFLAQTKKIS